MPAWPYASLERWHHLSFLKTNEVMNMLDTIKWQAVHPDMIEALIHLIKHDLGYQLHQAVQKVKCDLSAHREARFAFSDGALTLDAVVVPGGLRELDWTGTSPRSKRAWIPCCSGRPSRGMTSTRSS